jgi:hypothetical protein
MSPRHLAAALALLSSPAFAAELTGGLRAGLGAGTASDFGESFLLSAGLRGQLGAVFPAGHAVFAVARLQPLTDLGLDDMVLSYSVGVGYERRFSLNDGWRPTLGVTVGAGGAGCATASCATCSGPRRASMSAFTACSASART